MENVGRRLNVQATAIAACALLENKLPYCVVGGAACTVLGSSRATEDVDIVVGKGKTLQARMHLKTDNRFSVARGTLHTVFRSSPDEEATEVELLAPPGLFKMPFDEFTPTILVNGVRILKPALLLNAKCGSITDRATEEKKRNDVEDIVYLLQWCKDQGEFPTSYETPNITIGFVEGFNSVYTQPMSLWTGAGWSTRDGRFLGHVCSD